MLYQEPITTVIAPAGSYSLTDLATAKNELDIPGSVVKDDAFTTRAIAQASSAISSYCSRNFVAEAVQDLFYRERDWGSQWRSPSQKILQLSRWPIIAVSSIVETDPDGNQTVLVEGTDFWIDAKRGTIERLDSNNLLPTFWYQSIIAVQYSAGYGALASGEAQTVPSVAPYTVTAANADEFSTDQGVTYANGTKLAKVAATPSAGQYTIDPATGAYGFAAADGGAAVLISYLFNAIPDDVVDAVLRLVTARSAQKGRDPMLMSNETPSLGAKRWWVGTAVGQKGNLPPEIASLVESYRAPPL